jgi:hypothetical protein
MSNAFKRLRIGQVISTVVASGLFASAISAQSTNGYDRALELASFDTAWVRVRDSYYDATMRGLNWVGLRDSLRPFVERGDSREDTRHAISTLLSRLGESHFGVLPATPWTRAPRRPRTGPETPVSNCGSSTPRSSSRASRPGHRRKR